MNDPLLDSLRQLPLPDADAAREARVRQLCHERLRRPSAGGAILDLLLAAAAAVYVMTAGAEALRLLTGA